MNDKDKEEFEKWCTEKFNIAPELVEEFKHTFIHKLRHTEEAWQFACDLKQKEIEQLKTENNIISNQVHTYVKMSDDAFKKLAVAVKALEKIINSNDDMASYNSVIDSIALKALEEIRGRNEQAK